MHYTVHACKDPHPATCIADQLPISPGLFSAADDAYMVCVKSPNAICAYHNGKIVGIFQYKVAPTNLVARGTAVSRKFRKHGIARALWAAAIRKEQPKVVCVTTISDGGHYLVQSLAKDFPHVKFLERDDRENWEATH